MTIFYAWVVPAYSSGSPVDHTWVTTYDNRTHNYPDIQSVVAAQEANWYCWGSFHPKGGASGHPDGFIGSQAGDRSIASCLVKPNVSSDSDYDARGTIFTYGVDGVCHQLANQVLYATGKGAAPLTVKQARGYAVSSFLYGTYGLQHQAWKRKLATCAGVKVLSSIDDIGGQPVTESPDDFEEHARSVLADNPARLAQLLTLRGQVQSFAAQAGPALVPPGADYLNERNQHLLNQAAALLSADEFQRIFGIAPGERIDLVDPNVER